MKYLCAALVISVMVCRTVSAEPKDSPEFYKKNYAESPISVEPQGRNKRGQEDGPIDVSGSAILGLHENYKKELQKQEKGNSQLKKEDAAEEGIEDSEVVTEPKTKAKAENDSDLFGDEPGVRVLAIGAVINSIDIRHFNQKIVELNEVARKHDFEMSRIYAVGDWGNMMVNLRPLTKVMARKGEIDTLQEVPKQFNITLSPTWIIETAEGDIVVEGLEPLGKYFNKKGEFVESKLKEAAVAVTPTPTLAAPS